MVSECYPSKRSQDEGICFSSGAYDMGGCVESSLIEIKFYGFMSKFSGEKVPGKEIKD